MYILFIILSFQLLIDSRVFFFISELIKFIQQITHLFYHYDIVRTDNPHTQKNALDFLKVNLIIRSHVCWRITIMKSHVL